MHPGVEVEVETLFQSITHTFRTNVVNRVQFVDELPAFKLAYPAEIESARRRRSPRIETRGDASLSFLQPFACDAPVVNVSEGGLAFEYGAELGRLRRGVVIRELLLELGSHPVVTVQGRVVGNVVAELGGITLPRRYRASLAFQGLSPEDGEVLQAYLAELKGLDVEA
jgi:c-di-GMP-binding flagellar brake protein YcgR